MISFVLFTLLCSLQRFEWVHFLLGKFVWHILYCIFVSNYVFLCSCFLWIVCSFLHPSVPVHIFVSLFALDCLLIPKSHFTCSLEYPSIPPHILLLCLLWTVCSFLNLSLPVPLNILPFCFLWIVSSLIIYAAPMVMKLHHNFHYNNKGTLSFQSQYFSQSGGSSQGWDSGEVWVRTFSCIH